MNRQRNPIRFLRTTAIGGLLFLLPLIVVGALIGQIVPIVMTIAQFLYKHVMPIQIPGGITIIVLIAIAIVMLLCFAAGMIARWSLGQKLSVWFEKNIVLLFPRYAILKDRMADTIGGDETRPQMKPVLVKFDEFMRIGFETERCDDNETVAIYLPGSPDPWSGKVVLVTVDRVEPLAAEFGETAGTCEHLGRGSAALIADSRMQDKDDPTPQ